MARAKGPQKLNILVNYFVEKEPIFIKAFLKNLESENTLKLENMKSLLKESENHKNDLDEKNRELKEVSDGYSSKVYHSDY